MENIAYLPQKSFHQHETGFYSGFIIRAFSEKGLNKLEEFICKVNVGFISLQIDEFYSIVETNGAETGFELLSLMDEISIRDFESHFEGCRPLHIEKVNINQTVICFQMSDEQMFRLPDKAVSFRLHLNTAINQTHAKPIERSIEVRLGYSHIPANHDGPFYQTLFHAFCKAKLTRISKGGYADLALQNRFNEIFENALLSFVYQPIIDLKTWRIIGWEAFVRGPEASYFHKPEVLFAYASELNRTHALDKICSRAAIESMGAIAANQHLFLNIHTSTLSNPAFDPDQFLHNGLAPENVVIEVADSTDDMARLVKHLRVCKEKNFKICIQIKSNLGLIFVASIHPDYIKIDPSLIREISYDAKKKAMVEGLVALCERIGVKVIAAGIETASEIKNLASAGVHLGQGYHIARPSLPKPVKAGGKEHLHAAACGKSREVRIQELVKPALVVKPDMMVSEVKDMLKDQPTLCGIVVVAETKPLGLLMSYQMDRLLGTQYGVSLFFRRAVSHLMDPQPLIVDSERSVSDVAREAMARENAKLYDDIIVCRENRVMGTVSVQDMMEFLARMEVENRRRAEAATRAKSAFLANMSHDIRTPMNAILGMADLLSESPLNDDQREFVKVFQNAGESLLALINDILDLSKVEAGQIELEPDDFNLHELVEHTCEVMAIKAREKGVDLVWRLESDTSEVVQGDAARLRQVLSNLVGNAVKFTDEGRIVVRVRPSQENLLHFSVKDSGVGIPINKQEHIFETFGQAHSGREYGGTGLGLSICKHLVQLMGGRIWVESAPGTGSIFHFTAKLDAVKYPVAEINDLRDDPAYCHGQDSPPLDILLAEDNENNRILFSFYLKHTAHHIDLAENGQICLQKFQAQNYDVVFMDIDMPVMDGYKAANAIRAWEKENNRAPTPIVALTAHALKGKRQESLDAGCSDHISKPFKKTQLLALLEKIALNKPQAAASDSCCSPEIDGHASVKRIVSVDAEIEPLIPKFLKNTESDLRELEAAIQTQDYEHIRRMGHRIKGASLCYGFDVLADEALRIENAGHEKQSIETIRALADQLETCFSESEIVFA